MFLQPERVPVTVYLSTDKDAPRLDRTPNCLQTILKACLVTGYGDKEGAGWSLAFEDNTKGVKVLKPAESSHIPFFMRISGDTGRQIKFEVLQNMTAIDNGELKLGFNSVLNYSGNYQDGRWCIVATNRSFWLFVEAGLSRPIDKNGTVVFCGDTAKNTRGERAVAMVHTFGYGLFTHNATMQASIFDQKSTNQTRIGSYFNGITNKTTQAVCSPAMIEHNNEIYPLPIYAPSNTNAVNYQEIVSHGRTFINHGHMPSSNSNAFVPTDFWEY